MDSLLSCFAISLSYPSWFSYLFRIPRVPRYYCYERSPIPSASRVHLLSDNLILYLLVPLLFVYSFRLSLTLSLASPLELPLTNTRLTDFKKTWTR